MPKIAGVDLSLTSTGLVIIDGEEVVFDQVIRSKNTGDDPISELNRLNGIIDGIHTSLHKYKPISMVLIEGLAFMARNTSALVQLSGLNYLLRSYLMANKETLGLENGMVIVAPTSLKKFVTGKGNANKEIMIMEIYKKYGQTFYDNNICDAYGLAICGRALVDKEFKLTVPQQEVTKLLSKQINYV